MNRGKLADNLSLMMVVILNAITAFWLGLLCFYSLLVTRLVHGGTLRIRKRDYILSARAIGTRDITIMFRHILPHLFSVTIGTLAKVCAMRSTPKTLD